MPTNLPVPKNIPAEKVLEWSREIDDVVQAMFFICGAITDDSQMQALISIVASQLNQINDNIDAIGRNLTQ